MAQERIPLEELTLRQLRRVASDYRVSRYSRMRKVELIAAIRAIDPNAAATQTIDPNAPLKGQSVVKTSAALIVPHTVVTPATPAAEETSPATPTEEVAPAMAPIAKEVTPATPVVEDSAPKAPAEEATASVETVSEDTTPEPIAEAVPAEEAAPEPVAEDTAPEAAAEEEALPTVVPVAEAVPSVTPVAEDAPPAPSMINQEPTPELTMPESVSEPTPEPISASTPEPQVEPTPEPTAIAETVAVEGSAVQESVEATKFDTGVTESVPPTPEEMAAIDANLPELPEGYGSSRITLLPRDPQWAFCYWDVPNEQKEELRRQGGQQLALRVYDVTDIDLNFQAPHSVQEYACDELAREWYLPLPVSDRDYAIDVGYRTADGRWLVLARSASVHVPPVFPSDWVEDVFVTIPWDEDLRGKTFATLVPPAKKVIKGAPDPQYDEVFATAEATEAQRIAGSLFGSMHQTPEDNLSSFIFPSGVGSWSVPTASGVGAVTASGMGMETPEFITPSGIGQLGFSASVPHREQHQPRKFWLVADAELIVYGATESDATVTIGGRPVKLNPDGTFRFQMSFQDGVIDYPILAVAKDGVQSRSVHMNFERQTPSRNTNTKDEAVEEWIS